MQKLGNYVAGHWIEGTGDQQILSDAVTGTPIYMAGTRGLDFQEILGLCQGAGKSCFEKNDFS